MGGRGGNERTRTLNEQEQSNAGQDEGFNKAMVNALGTVLLPPRNMLSLAPGFAGFGCKASSAQGLAIGSG
jgi:hypothetical protein